MARGQPLIEVVLKNRVYLGIERTLPIPKWGICWIKDADAVHVWILNIEVVISRN